MEHEFGLPSPVDRKDLPKRKRRWPKVVAALMGLLILLIAFLPQIMRIGPGKALAAWHLERQTRMKVTIGKIQTSWTGGTILQNVWFSDVKGPRLGAAYLKCDASLWKLIKGDFALGEADVHGLLLDFVVDYGDGRNLIDAMDPPPPPPTPDGPPGTPPAPVKKEPKPWPLSGNIKINKSTLLLTRGQVVDEKGYPTVYHVVRFNDVNGTINMAANGGAWTFDLAAEVPASVKDEPSGTAKFTGTLNLGRYASISDAASTGEMKLGIRRMPTVSLVADGKRRISGLSVIDPNLTGEEWERTVGKVVQSIDIAATVADGKMSLKTRLVGSNLGPEPGQLDIPSGVPTIEGPAVINWGAKPVYVEQGDEPLKISLRSGRKIAQTYLAAINPFLQDLSAGWTDLKLEKFRLPLGKTPEKASVSGVLTQSQSRLAIDIDWFKGFEPTSLAGQWQRIVVGNGEKQIRFESGPVRFDAASQWCTPEGKKLSFALDGVPVLLSGVTAPDQKLKFEANLKLGAEASKIPEASAGLKMPLTGTLAKPQLDTTKAVLSADGVKQLNGMLEDHQRDQNAKAISRMQEETEKKGE